jgi:hypothetical protein
MEREQKIRRVEIIKQLSSCDDRIRLLTGKLDAVEHHYQLVARLQAQLALISPFRNVIK